MNFGKAEKMFLSKLQMALAQKHIRKAVQAEIEWLDYQIRAKFNVNFTYERTFPDIVLTTQTIRNQKLQLIIASHPHLYIQRPFYNFKESPIGNFLNVFVRDFEYRYPDLCFDIMLVNSVEKKN